jgi:hypothetical protein
MASPLREIDETRQGGLGGAEKPDALGHGVILSLADGLGYGRRVRSKLVGGQRKSAFVGSAGDRLGTTPLP